MQLQATDLFALIIAIGSLNTILIIAFRRVYVLERRLRRYERYYEAR